ncbi:MAG TPA: PAS domain-containing protein [Longimicrobiaceae bacterium]
MITTLSRYIESTSFRLDDLVRRARTAGPPDRSLLDQSLEELSSTLEELRVSEEELRAQTEGMAASRGQLEAELQRYRDLFRLAPDPYLVTDADGVIREANAAASALLGVREEALPGKPLVVFVPEEDRKAFRTQLPWLFETERLTGWKLRLAPRNGAPRAVEVTVCSERGTSGAPSGLRWTVRDAPAREEAPAPAAAPAAPALEARAWPGEEASEARRAPSRPDAEAWRAAFLEVAGRRVDPSARSAVYELEALLRDSVARALYEGKLLEGDRLPGIRETARATGLNHKCVTRAYQALLAEGMLEVRDRSGVYVARQGWWEGEPEEERGRWLTEMLTDAWSHRIDLPALPELVRRGADAARLRCVCVESSPERRGPLCVELRERFGLDPLALALEELPDGGREAALAGSLREADVVVTTPFHAGPVRALARAMGKPMLVATMHPLADAGPGAAAMSSETARRLAETLVHLNLRATAVGP